MSDNEEDRNSYAEAQIRRDSVISSSFGGWGVLFWLTIFFTVVGDRQLRDVRVRSRLRTRLHGARPVNQTPSPLPFTSRERTCADCLCVVEVDDIDDLALCNACLEDRHTAERGLHEENPQAGARHVAKIRGIGFVPLTTPWKH